MLLVSQLNTPVDFLTPGTWAGQESFGEMEFT